MYTVTRTLEFTPLEWLGVIAATAAYNAGRPGEPPLTPEAYLQARLSDVARSYAEQHQQALAQAALTKLAGASADVQGQVFTALGLGAVAAADPAAAGELALGRFLRAPAEAREQLAALVYPENADAAG